MGKAARFKAYSEKSSKLPANDSIMDQPYQNAAEGIIIQIGDKCHHDVDDSSESDPLTKGKGSS